MSKKQKNRILVHYGIPTHACCRTHTEAFGQYVDMFHSGTFNEILAGLHTWRARHGLHDDYSRPLPQNDLNVTESLLQLVPLDRLTVLLESLVSGPGTADDVGRGMSPRQDQLSAWGYIQLLTSRGIRRHASQP